MEDFRLKVFESVARNGKFSAAGRELGISQAAVSQNIAELERMIGANLFVRERAGVILTQTGAEFLRYASKIIFWYDKINSVFVQKNEASDSPTLLKLSNNDAEISVVDGEIHIKII